MMKELLKRLVAFRDAVMKNGNTMEAGQFLSEADEAVLKGALDNVSSEYQDQLFELITEIDALEHMGPHNRGRFESTVELVENTLYEKG